MAVAQAELGAAAGRKIVLVVAGGIAAYKAVQVARDLAEAGADVRVVMTRNAKRFVGTQSFAALSGNPVATELFGSGAEVPHVELARGAALVIVAPATANLIAKAAIGLADDLASAVLLTARCPLVIAPAMHTEMWEHPATRANVELLAARGARLVGPVSGPLSSGDRGPGRMAEPEDIVAAALDVLGWARSLAGRHFVVTAGGTQEPLDPVRFIGNRSSGLMGFAIAEEALRRGAKVTLVAGATSASPPPGADLVKVRTAEDMRAAVLAAAPTADVIVKAAAVADFRPVSPAAVKLKKAAGPPRLELEHTPDILAELGANPALRKPGSLLVGFAAETEPEPGALAELARAKLAAKKADVIVANDVSSPDSGFEVPTNRAVIAHAQGEVVDLGLVTKAELARALVDDLTARLG